jgi:CheY-like chemotaxis protein
VAETTDRPILVLVVDDEPLVRMLGADILEDAGFGVVEAGDAAEALEKLKDHPDVSVLFTDINMPGALDGLDLARVVHESRPDIRLLIASGRVRPDPGDLPAGQFVAKPWDAEDVIGRIRRML